MLLKWAFNGQLQPLTPSPSSYFRFREMLRISFHNSIAFQRNGRRVHTLFPAPPTRSTSSGFMAVTQSVTNLLLCERVVVMMCFPAGASFSWNPKAPKPKTPQIVLPSVASGPAYASE